MSLRIWVSQRRWSWSPQWFQRWQHQQRIRWLQARQVPAMLAVQEAGVGLSEVWAGPGTSGDEILSWFTEKISATPRPLAPSTDQFRLLVARCTEAEWEAAQEPDAVVRLSADRYVARWTGHRSQWWWDGHETIARAIPPQHDGLYLALNAVGTVFDAPLATTTGEPYGTG